MNLPVIAPAMTSIRAPGDDAHSQSPEKLRKACQDFEAILIATMFKDMRNTVPDSGLLGESNERQMFVEMMDQQVATELAHSQGLGIGEALYGQLQKFTG
jgi:flagellar protein FlgJ